MGRIKIIWSKNALESLDDIEQFIGMDNPERAIQFTNLLIEKSMLLSQNLYLGRIVPEFADTNLRELIVKNYRIVYQLHKNKVVIVTVHEGHRLIEADDIDSIGIKKGIEDDEDTIVI